MPMLPTDPPGIARDLLEDALAWCDQRAKTLPTVLGRGKHPRTQYDAPTRKRIKSVLIGKTRFRVLARDKFTCQYCGATPKDGVRLHVDHVIPKSQGGSDLLTNLLTACVACNEGKGTMRLGVRPK